MRRWAANLLLLCATLVLLEWLLGRVLGGSEHAVLYDPSSSATGCCGQLRPSASADYTGWFLRIPRIRQEVNAHGYRGPERSQTKASSVLRLAAIGDSYTYGLGTAADETIPAYLEAMLDRGDAQSVEVLNFGVPGAQLPDTIERTRCFVSRWHPDIVLYFMYADDLEQPLCHWKGVAELGARLVRGELSALTHDWRTTVELAEGLATWRSSLVRAARLAYLLMSRWLTAVSEDSWDPLLRQHLQSLQEASRQAGATLAVIVLGDPSAYRRSPRVGEILGRQGIPWLDGRKWLFGRLEDHLPVIPRDGHLSANGNRAVATQLAEWLIQSNIVSANGAMSRSDASHREQ